MGAGGRKREISIMRRGIWVHTACGREECIMAERKQSRRRPAEMADAIIAEQRKKDPTDVLGSYTGVPWDEWDDPVQDADDL